MPKIRLLQLDLSGFIGSQWWGNEASQVRRSVERVDEKCIGLSINQYGSSLALIYGRIYEIAIVDGIWIWNMDVDASGSM